MADVQAWNSKHRVSSTPGRSGVRGWKPNSAQSPFIQIPANTPALVLIKSTL